MEFSAPLLAGEMKVAEGIVLALQDAGVELALGISANRMAPICEALIGHKRIRSIEVRQELLGTLAANAYGRLTSRPAVIMGGGQFVLGTGTQGIIESLMGSTPVVILTERCDGGGMSHHRYWQSGSGEYATYDAVAALRAICKRVFVAQYPAQAVQMVQHRGRREAQQALRRLLLGHEVGGDLLQMACVLHRTRDRLALDPLRGPLFKSGGHQEPL